MVLKWAGSEKVSRFDVLQGMKKEKHRVVKNPKTGETFIETPQELWAERLAVWNTDHSQPCPMPTDHRMFRFPHEYGQGYERLPDVSVQIDLFPTTIAAVQKAERQFEGEDFCICDHQRKYHRASERECANCDCVIFLSPERARKFQQETGMVPAEVDGSDYTERLTKTFRHPA